MLLDANLAAEVAALGALALGITQAVKKWTGLDDKLAIAVSAVVSVLLAWWKTATAVTATLPFDWVKGITIAIATFIEANGIYHFGAKALTKQDQTEDGFLTTRIADWRKARNDAKRQRALHK